MLGTGIREVRGRGAMLGMELESADLTEKVVGRCKQEGIILGWTLHSNTLVRLAPPLILEHEVWEKSLKLIRGVIEEIHQSS